MANFEFFDFARILMGSCTKLIFCHYWSILKIKRQIVAKLSQHDEIQIRRLGYVSFYVYMVCSSLKFVTFPFFIFLHFWMFPNRKYCIQSRKLVENRQTVINFHEKIEFHVFPDKWAIQIRCFGTILMPGTTCRKTVIQ